MQFLNYAHWPGFKLNQELSGGAGDVRLLDRCGDRRINSALHMAAITRMTYDTEACDYVEKRRGEGKTDKEIRRCVKRYLDRRVFRILAAAARAKKVQEAA
jgi:transposase